MLGHHVAKQYFRTEFRKEIGENPEKTFTVQVQSLTELNWVKFKKEFQFNHSLCDVVEISKTKNGFSIIAFADGKDQQFEKKWSKTKRERSPDIQKQKDPVKFIKIIPTVGDLIPENENVLCASVPEQMPVSTADVPTPPPRCLA